MTVNYLEKVHSKYEIIFLFHVLEHLTNPIDQLVELGKYLAPGGGIYIETPNANDALAVKYECEAFRNLHIGVSTLCCIMKYRLKDC